MATSEPYADLIAELAVQVYNIHEITIAENGGLEGLRDGAMLHAAVSRPFATFGGEDLYPGDFEKAAALFHSLIKSHPFMDGTKRTAFLSAIYYRKTTTSGSGPKNGSTSVGKMTGIM